MGENRRSYCENCGSLLNPKAKFCRNCGAATNRPDNNPQQSVKPVYSPPSMSAPIMMPFPKTSPQIQPSKPMAETNSEHVVETIL